MGVSPGRYRLQYRLLALTVRVAALACMLWPAMTIADEAMKSGNWKGALITHQQKQYDVEYKVRISDSGKIRITMKIPSLELNNLKLKNIRLKDENLSFKLPMEPEIKACVLEYDEGIYAGRCTSDKGGDNKFTEITMIPPGWEAKKTEDDETEAEDDEAENGDDTANAANSKKSGGDDKKKSKRKNKKKSDD